VGQYARVKNRGAGDIASSVECTLQSAGQRVSCIGCTHARTQYLSSSSLCPDHLGDSSVVEAMWFLAGLDRDVVLGETTESQCARGKRRILVLGRIVLRRC
jgi:hypothetical protein